MMYQSFENPITCFRRFNGTHQFGCSTPRSGNFGVVIILKSKSDLDWLLSKAVAGPYMVALRPDMFNRFLFNIMTVLENNSNIISGILLLVDPNVQPESFSPDDTCPNRYSSGASGCMNNWNPYGNGFLLKDWPFPIFYVHNVDTIKSIEDCNRINLPQDETQLSRALCSIRMKSHMFGAVNSQTCIGRSELINFNQFRYCDPLGDQNIFLSFGDVLTQSHKNTIVLAARLDAASLFESKAPGAMTAISGLVTLLTTAHILYNMLYQKVYSK
ncbi:hypothetical protein AAG570_008121 [Ranatra chinensis]|uniref:Nicastrin n=1 Tax=Ranatra chinensis TaxID=642074 RepID=A0ABD0Y939_9HEMI